MISLLAFVLECAATAALVGAAVSLLALPLLLVSRTFCKRWQPVWRADAAFLVGILPALISIVIVFAATLPSVGSGLGWMEDHCQAHLHHLHLCLFHSAGLRPALATLGAFALSTFLFRAGLLLKRLADTHLSIKTLERLGTVRVGSFPIVVVPGAPRLCHAVGIIRPRIVVSAALAESIGADSTGAALAHEEAHLRRQDPASLLLLSVAGLFWVPGFDRLASNLFQAAMEETCDAAAAAAVGSPAMVATALVKVASVQRDRSPVAPYLAAFGGSALERRVHLLLEGDGTAPPPGRSLALAALSAAAALAAGTLHSGTLHHAVETALHVLF